MPTRRSGNFLMILILLIGNSCSKRPNIIVNDFESRNFGEWQIAGNAFGSGPSGRIEASQSGLRGLRGDKIANSLHGGESGLGSLISPKFKIERRYINFLSGGGKFPDSTGVHLIIDNKVIYKSTGNNLDSLEWNSWDLSDYKDKSATLLIFDFASGKMGYFLIDQIVQSDISATRPKPDLQSQFVCEKKYLMLPVKSGAPLHKMKLIVDNQTVRRFDAELAEPCCIDFWKFIDIGEFKGKQATLQANQYWDSDPKSLGRVVQSDTLAAKAN